MVITVYKRHDEGTDVIATINSSSGTWTGTKIDFVKRIMSDLKLDPESKEDLEMLPHRLVGSMVWAVADKIPEEHIKERKIVILKGGPNSGNHGHAGRPGKIGGSGPGKIVTIGKFAKYQTNGRFVIEPSENIPGGSMLIDNVDGFLVDFNTKSQANRAAVFARTYVKKWGDIHLGSFPYSLNQPFPSDEELKKLSLDPHKLKSAIEPSKLSGNRLTIGDTTYLLRPQWAAIIRDHGGFDKWKTDKIESLRKIGKDRLADRYETMTVQEIINRDGIATSKVKKEEEIIIEKGGETSGNYGHAGRPGHIGGSVKRGSAAAKKVVLAKPKVLQPTDKRLSPKKFPYTKNKFPIVTQSVGGYGNVIYKDSVAHVTLIKRNGKFRAVVGVYGSDTNKKDGRIGYEYTLGEEETAAFVNWMQANHYKDDMEKWQKGYEDGTQSLISSGMYQLGFSSEGTFYKTANMTAGLSRFYELRQKIAEDYNIPEEDITYGGKGYPFTVGNVQYSAGGHYDSSLHKVVMFDDMSDYTDEQAYGQIAHEALHYNFEKVMTEYVKQQEEVGNIMKSEFSLPGADRTIGADGLPKTADAKERYAIYTFVDSEIMKFDNPNHNSRVKVYSDYAASYWKKFYDSKFHNTPNYLSAMNESLAEVGRMKEKGSKAYALVPTYWKNLFDKTLQLGKSISPSQHRTNVLNGYEFHKKYS